VGYEQLMLGSFVSLRSLSLASAGKLILLGSLVGLAGSSLAVKRFLKDVL
jgi:hypothetical protein